MTLYDVDRRLIRGRYQVGTDTVTVEARSPEEAGELAALEPHGLEMNNIRATCWNVRQAPPPKAVLDEYMPRGPSAALEGFVVSEREDGAIVAQTLKRKPGRPRKNAA